MSDVEEDVAVGKVRAVVVTGRLRHGRIPRDGLVMPIGDEINGFIECPPVTSI